MQIIYSAGTTSPTSPRTSPLPSPRHRPKSPRSPRQLNYYEGWRPVMPGYKAPPSHHQPAVVIQRTVEVQHLTGATDTNLKDSIPDMPRALAITCLICNIVLPGLGTLVSGLSVLCCSTPRPRTRDKSSILWVNSWVALFQFLTTFLCLLGWIWSIMWGVSFISISGRSKTDSPEDEGSDSTADDQQTAAQQRATNSRTTTTTTVSVPSNGGNPTVPDGGSETILGGRGQDSSAPIIILQEPPIIIPPPEGTTPINSSATLADSGSTDAVNGSGTNNGRTLNPYNPRHQRVLRQQESLDDQLPSILLTPDALEQLVFHNAPLPIDGPNVDPEQRPIGAGKM